LPQALRHLQCTYEEQSTVQTVLAELKHSIDTPQNEPQLARDA
jgi:hypothetical protein